MDDQPSFEETQEAPQAQPSFEETQDPQQEAQQPSFEETDPADKYSTLGQKAITAVENTAQGLLGPIATAAETTNIPAVHGHGVSMPAVGPMSTPQDMAARASENSGIAGASHVVGNIGQMALVPEIAAEGRLAQIGANAIRGGIQSGMITGSDEISKSMLGQGDPNTPVASALIHTGVSALFGSILGGAFSSGLYLAKNKLADLAEKKAGSKFISWVAGMGHAASGAAPEAEQSIINPELLNSPYFKLGQKTYKTVEQQVIPLAVGAVSADKAPEGQKLGAFASGYSSSRFMEMAGQKILGPLISKASQKIMAPMLIKMASSGTAENLAQAVNYGNAIGKGSSKAINAIESLFRSGSNEALNYETSPQQREKIKKHIEDGGTETAVRTESQQNGTTQGFADGGEIPNPNQNAIAEHWPEQNVLINAAKMRVSNYLNANRPLPKVGKLPYDSEPKDPLKARKYDQLVDLADQPLSILKKVKDGTLNHETLGHFTSMYPEVHSELSKQITKRITEGQLKNETKPPYKVRQALSLFLGSNLDSTLNQPNIMAAQAVFAQQKNQQQQRVNMSGMSKISQTAKTPSQARDEALTKT